MRASSDEVAALKARLRQRQEQRQFDADADEAIRLVRRRVPSQSGLRPASSPSGGAKEERTALEAREYVAQVIPAGNAFSAAAVAVILARSVVDNWLFLLVLGFVVFGAAAVI